MGDSKELFTLVQALKWMSTYAKRYYHWLIVSVVSALVLTSINVANAYFVKKLINTAWYGNYNNLITIIPILAIIVVLGFFINYLSTYSSGRFGVYIELDLKQNIAKHDRPY